MLSFHCHISAQRHEINKKWLHLPRKHNVRKNLLSSVIGVYVVIAILVQSFKWSPFSDKLFCDFTFFTVENRVSLKCVDTR